MSEYLSNLAAIVAEHERAIGIYEARLDEIRDSEELQAHAVRTQIEFILLNVRAALIEKQQALEHARMIEELPRPVVPFWPAPSRAFPDALRDGQVTDGMQAASCAGVNSGMLTASEEPAFEIRVSPVFSSVDYLQITKYDFYDAASRIEQGCIQEGPICENCARSVYILKEFARHLGKNTIAIPKATPGTDQTQPDAQHGTEVAKP